MEIRSITKEQRKQFNSVATHPLQAYEWGEFRDKTGIKIIRRGIFEKEKIVKSFQLTVHPLPFTPWNIGYLPKGYLPDKELLEELQKIGLEEKCIFIQVEPNVQKKDGESHIKQLENTPGIRFRPSYRPLFTKYSFQLDLTKSEGEILKNMHSKTRYNIKIAKKHIVEVVEDNSSKAFETYWHLMEETTNRQKFYAHTKNYHRIMWETLNGDHLENKKTDPQALQAHLFLAKYTPPDQKTPIDLTAWVLFTFQNTLYYPYGASTAAHKNVMATNLLMWEAIVYGKKHGFQLFDMWGAMSDSPDISDPWYGFHRFKQGYGPKHVEFVGSFDLVINPLLYRVYILADNLRWVYLRLKNNLKI